jgi:hypothetical protein
MRGAQSASRVRRERTLRRSAGGGTPSGLPEGALEEAPQPFTVDAGHRSSPLNGVAAVEFADPLDRVHDREASRQLERGLEGRVEQDQLSKARSRARGATLFIGSSGPRVW